MNKKDFLKQYQSEWWMETSKRIKARDHNTCQMCGCNDKPLSVHHLYYNNGSINVSDESLITLCEDCHLQQKRSRGEVYEYLDELRKEYTDYEIAKMLSMVNRMCISNSCAPICYKKTDLSKLFESSENCCEDEKIKNLEVWRKATIGNKIIEEAVYQYIAFKEIKEKVRDWFKNVFGSDIGLYISKHESELSEIIKKAKHVFNRSKNNSNRTQEMPF